MMQGDLGVLAEFGMYYRMPSRHSVGEAKKGSGAKPQATPSPAVLPASRVRGRSPLSETPGPSTRRSRLGGK
jgi:hypothetical protein